MFEAKDLGNANFAREEFLDVIWRSVSLRDDLDCDVAPMTLGARQLHDRVRACRNYTDVSPL